MIYFKVERGQGNVLRHFAEKEENNLFGVHIYRSATIYNHFLENIVLTSLDISDLVSSLIFENFAFRLKMSFQFSRDSKNAKKLPL